MPSPDRPEMRATSRSDLCDTHEVLIEGVALPRRSTDVLDLLSDPAIKPSHLFVARPLNGPKGTVEYFLRTLDGFILVPKSSIENSVLAQIGHTTFETLLYRTKIKRAYDIDVCPPRPLLNIHNTRWALVKKSLATPPCEQAISNACTSDGWEIVPVASEACEESDCDELTLSGAFSIDELEL